MNSVKRDRKTAGIIIILLPFMFKLRSHTGHLTQSSVQLKPGSALQFSVGFSRVSDCRISLCGHRKNPLYLGDVEASYKTVTVLTAFKHTLLSHSVYLFVCLSASPFSLYSPFHSPLFLNLSH